MSNSGSDRSIVKLPNVGSLIRRVDESVLEGSPYTATHLVGLLARKRKIRVVRNVQPRRDLTHGQPE